MMWSVVLIGVIITIFELPATSLAQRIPPPPQSLLNNLNNPPIQNSSNLNLQILQQQQKEEISNVKDENIKRVLLELSTLQTTTQMTETMVRVAQLVGQLFLANFEQRKDVISAQGSSEFPQRLLSAVTDIQGEEVKSMVLQKKLENLHSGDFAFLPLAIQYGLQKDILRNLSGTKLASVIKVNPGDTVIAYKISVALFNRLDQQLEFLQSMGTKLLPDVQRVIMRQLLDWWGDPHTWKDRELSLLTSAGTPLLAYLPQSELESLDDELADRFVTILGQTQDIARSWWKKPMSVKKSWFELAKGARYFGAVHEWSFRRMQKLSFLLEGASPEDLELIPPVPEIKGLVIGNHYTELQARVVFDAFYHSAPLSQEDLQEFQFHVLDLIPVQLQRFDFADSFGTLDEMMSILEQQPIPSYPTVLQISYFMCPIVNSSSDMVIAPPTVWQKRELSQIGKLFFMLPKSVIAQIKPEIFNWDSNILPTIRSKHLSRFQIWKLTSQILLTVDDRFKPDYIFMVPSPFQKGVPTHNISQALLGSTSIRPEIFRALIVETSGMLTSQKAVILQRLHHRIGDPVIIRTMVNTEVPSEMFSLISPKVLTKNMGTIIKTILEMPETGRFGLTSIQVKLLPQVMLSIWLKWVRENGQIKRWTAEDLLGRSPLGATHELDLAILGLTCRDIEVVDPWDILSVIMNYRHELYILRRFEPTLRFNANLRICVLLKFLEYLKQKRFLNDDKDGQLLSGITGGEIQAVGGEVLSTIPTKVLDTLDAETRQNIIKEIGKLQMLELFSLVPLDDLHTYGSTLFRDIEISITNSDRALRKKRQSEPSEVAKDTESKSTSNTDSTTPITENVDDTGPLPIPGIDSRAVVGNSTEETTSTVHSIHSPKTNIDLESLNTMGNLLCYAENMFDINWPRNLLKDVLEAKTSIGEKTCCLSKHLREKWFEALKTAYGADPSSWNEFDLTAMGDLLIALPDSELQRISTDSLSKAVTPMLRQSAYASKISIPGEIKSVQFVTTCIDALGTEGADFMVAYKIFMKRLFQASQWLVNTVKTTQELIREGVGRTGRIPRWAEHTLVKRQIPITLGSELSYSGSSPSYSPTVSTTNFAPQVYFQQPVSTIPIQAQTQNQGFVYSPSPVIISPSQSSVNPTTASFGYSQGAPSNTPQYVVVNPSQISPTQSTATFSPQQSFVSSPQPLNNLQSTVYYAQQPTNQYQAQVQPVTGYYYPSSTFTSQTNQQPMTIGAAVQVQPVNSFQFNSGAASTNVGSTFIQQPLGSGTAANAAAGSGNAGSFAQANTFAQSDGGVGGTNNNAFAQGGSFTQASDLSQTGGQTNTFAARAAGNNPQQQLGNMGIQGQQQQSGNMGLQSLQQGGNIGVQQQSGGNAGAQQQGGNMGAQSQQQGGNMGAQSQQQGGNMGAQSQQQGGNMGAQSQQQGGNTGAQQQGGNMGAQSQQQGGNTGAQQQGGNTGAQSQQQGGNMGAQSQQQGGNMGAQSQQQGGNMGSQLQQQGANMGAQLQQQGGNMGAQSPQQGGNVGTQQQQLGGNAGAQQQQPGGNMGAQQGGNSPQSSIIGIQSAGVKMSSQSGIAAGRVSGGDLSDSRAGIDLRQRSIDFGAFQEESHNSEITCHGLKAAGKSAIGLTIDDLNKLTQVDLFDCIEAIGSIEWDDETKGRILSLLKQKLELNKDTITALTLIEMGDLVTAFNAKPKDDGLSDAFSSNASKNLSTSESDTIHSDISMLDFTLPRSLDVLSILGQQIVDPSLLKSLAEKFNQDNKIFPGFAEGMARPENLRIVVMSLGCIVCGLNDKIVNSIFETDATLFMDTSSVLGKLEGCSMEVLSTLASHAVRPSNYGQPRLWSQEDMEYVGVVFAGMKPEAISTISPDALQGVTPLAIKNLPLTSISSLTVEQLSKISFNAAKAFTPAQLNSLTNQQMQALQSVIQVSLDVFSLSGSNDTVENTHMDNIRNLEENKTGRARDEDLTTPAPVTTTTTTTTEKTTTTPPPVVVHAEEPQKSSSVNVSPFIAFSYFLFIPVIQVLFGL